MVKHLFLYFILIAIIAQSCGTKQHAVSPIASNTQGSKAAIEKLYYVAEKLRLEKQIRKAADTLKTLVALEPNHAAGHYFLAKCLLQLENTSGALVHSKKAVALQKNNLYYRTLLAESYAVNDQIDLAIVEYKNLAKAQPSLAETHLYKAAFYANFSRKYEEALALYDEIQKQYGFNEEISFRKIALYKKLNNQKKILLEIDGLIAENPGDVNFQLLKLEAYNDAKDSISYKNLLKQLETNFADDPKIMPTLVLKNLVEGDTVKYRSMLKQAMNNKSITPEDKLNMLVPIVAESEKDTNILIELIAYSKQIVSSAPNDAKAIGIYASVLGAAGKFEEAAEQYKILLSKDPSKLETWQQVISLYSAAAKYDSVISLTNRAKQYFPNQSYLYLMNAVAHQQKENYNQALIAYGKALDYALGNKLEQSNIYSQLGDTYNNLKKYQESDSCFDAAIKLDPNNEGALNNYAYFLSLRKEKLDQAAKMSKQSLVVRPGEKTYLDTYAWVLFMQAKYKEALEQMELAIKANGNTDATLWEHYGDILFYLGRTNDALENWKKAKDLKSKSKMLDKKIADKQYYEEI